MIGIIIQARLGSTRLPRKMTLPFYESKGIFEIQLTRLIDAKINIPIVLSTTCNQEDDELIEIVKKYNIKFYRGSQENVLDRFIKTAETFQFDKIIRICADNPFIDMNNLSNQIINFKNSDFDYLSFSISNNLPTILSHCGFWGEAVKLSALKVIANSTCELTYLEHVTKFIYKNPDQFKIQYIKVNNTDINFNKIRLTVDDQIDYEITKEVYFNLKSKNVSISISNVTRFIKNRPDLLIIMNKQILNNVK
jgi:spore coat polysaccharide biosynthesis protein SpsF (cytidylyltransferase family)